MPYINLTFVNHSDNFSHLVMHYHIEYAVYSFVFTELCPVSVLFYIAFLQVLNRTHSKSSSVT